MLLSTISLLILPIALSFWQALSIMLFRLLGLFPSFSSIDIIQFDVRITQLLLLFRLIWDIIKGSELSIVMRRIYLEPNDYD